MVVDDWKFLELLIIIFFPTKFKSLRFFISEAFVEMKFVISLMNLMRKHTNTDRI